jgi:starch synthase
MYSLKYGTIPVVRATGGLDDTIEQWDATTGTGNGFKFDNLTRKELYQAIRHAIKVFTNTDAWAILRGNAMAFSRSWDEAAVDYEDVYRAALRNRQAE